MSIFAQGDTARSSVGGTDPALEISSMRRLAAALGEPGFAGALLAVAQAHADIDQISLFALDESSGFESIFNIGTLLAPQAAARLSRLYCEEYFQLDPLFDRVARYRNALEADIEVHSSATLRSADPLSQHIGFGAKCSLIFEKDGPTYYLSCYRRHGAPHFSDAECKTIEQFSAPLRGLIHAHHRLMRKYEGEAWPSQAVMGGHDCRSAEQLLFSVHHLLARDGA